MIKRIQKAFKDLHGCEANHVESVPVVEQFEGKTAWDGSVEVFDLVGHPRASQGYGWEHETDTGGTRVVTVLKIPPATSPNEAVRVAIVAEVRRPN